MRNPIKIASAALAAFALVAAHPAFAADAVVGDYVEARSASVYAGACHYNAERISGGREAVLAFNVRKGTLKGADLTGLSVVAVVTGSQNLADKDTTRRSVVYVTDKATPAQRDALVALLRAKTEGAIGTVVAVKSAPQKLRFDSDTITVKSGETVSLNVSRYPCKHCLMPAETWYAPLVKTTGEALVAQGVSTGFSEKSLLGVTWRQEPSDNAFVGTFSL